MDESSDENFLISHSKLVELAQAGDTGAFTDLFNYYLPHIARYVVGLGSSPDARDDLLQDIFLKAWKDLPRLQQTCAFKSWLYRIATNVVCDYWRKQKSSKRSELISLHECLEDSETPDPSQGFDECIGEHELVRQALKEIPATYRTCLILEIQGFSRGEIAEVAGIGPSSVGTYVSKARRFFRQAYHHLNQPPDENKRSES